MFGAAAYQSVALAGDSPWQLIDRLYEGAIQRIDEGKREKAFDIVSLGLHGSLNPTVPFSRGMADVYEVIMAHLSRPDGKLSVARSMLVTMREAWHGIKPKD